jgi:glycosyltransferase involved in cell wall biosynthesis
MEKRKLIIIPVFNKARFLENNLPSLHDLPCDILIMDDGSNDNTYNVIKDQEWIKYIKHELQLGQGASFTTAYEYARDLDYDYIFLFDHLNTRYKEELDQLMQNLSYGYDIVNSSRILENYNYKDIPQEHISLTAEISDNLKNITTYDITDPLSGIKALRMETLKNMELTETTHGLFLQLWIQAHYFGLSIIEIPALTGNGFGNELSLYTDPLGHFISIMETEKYLFPDKNLH